MAEAPPAVLIFRLGSLGDTIVSLPCFHAIARRFGRSRRIVVTNSPVSEKAPRMEAILGGSGLVHDYLEFKSPLDIFHSRTLLAEVRATGASTLVYLGPRPSRAAFLRDLVFFRLAGIKQIHGGSPLRRLRNREDARTGFLDHEAKFLASSIESVGRIDLDDRSFWDLRLTEQEKKRAADLVRGVAGGGFIIVGAGGKVAKNQWGQDRWRDVLNRISNAWPGLGIVFVGSKDEKASYEDLAGAWAGPSVIAAGYLSPRETAAAISQSRAFVGHDSGPLHLAAAMDVPCVGIFGDNNPPGRWHPYGGIHRVIHSTAGVAKIQPDLVVDSLQALLSTATDHQNDLLSSRCANATTVILN